MIEGIRAIDPKLVLMGLAGAPITWACVAGGAGVTANNVPQPCTVAP